MAVVLLLAAGGTAVWLAEGDEVAPGALATVGPGVDVVAVMDADATTVAISGAEPTIGLVLLPGWRIEREAYVPVLAELVRVAADRGVAIAALVPSVPLNTALLGGDHTAAGRTVLAERFPDVATWVVGGHSLGGVVAAERLFEATVDAGGDNPWDGLLTWASVPPRDVSLGALTVPTLAVAGGSDDVVPAAVVQGDLGRLPIGADLVVVDAMTHQQFGRYAEPRTGDGPGSDAATLDRLVDVTVSWLAEDVLGADG